MTWSECRWDESNIGVLEEYVKTNFRVFDRLSEFFSERQLHEQEYLRHISKLVKRFTPTAEMGTNKIFRDLMKDELEEEVVIHSDSVTGYKKIVDLLTSEAKELRKNFKRIQIEVQKHLKHLIGLFSTHTKFKAKYTKLCAENDALEVKCQAIRMDQNSTQQDLKSLAKMEGHLKKSLKLQQTSEQEYLDSIKNIEDYMFCYDAAMKTNVESYISLLNKEWECIKSAMDLYARIFKNKSTRLDSGRNIILEMTDKISSNDDHNEWINMNIVSSTIISVPKPEIHSFKNENDLSNKYDTPYQAETFINPSDNMEYESPSARHSSSSVVDGTANNDYVAGWAYSAVESDELSFNAGEILSVFNKKEDGWWEAVNSLGQTGLVPGNYLLEQ